MGKRRKDEDSDDEIVKKIKKLEEKLKERRNKGQNEENVSTHQSGQPDYNDFGLDDSIYLPPSEWAGTVSPGSQQPLYIESEEIIEPQQVIDLSPQPGPSSAPDFPSSYTPKRLVAITPNSIPEVPATEKDLDEGILNLLGDAPKSEIVFGSKIHKDIASRWQEVLAKGLTKETKEKLVADHLIPENCDMMVPPILNPEAKAALPENLIKRDFSLLAKQKVIAAALSALAQVTIMVISNECSKEKILKPLSDAGRLLCDSHFTETKTRRSFVISSINTNLKGALIDANRDNKFLFGENLTEKLNAAKTIQKSGDTLKNTYKPQTKSYNNNNKDKRPRLNSKALHPRQPASRYDAGPTRSTAYRPTAYRAQPPPPPPRRPRTPPPQPHHHPRTQHTSHRR